MRNYAPINDDKDVVTKEYVDPIKSQAALNRTTLGYSKKNLFDWKVSNKAENFYTTVTSETDTTISMSSKTKWSRISYKLPTVEIDKSYILSVKISDLDESGGNSTMLILSSDLSGNNVINAVRLENNGVYELEFNVQGNEESIYLLLCLNWSSTNFTDSSNSFTVSEVMLRYADITDDTYEPYKESVDERLIENKSNTAINKSTLGYQCKNLLKNNAVTTTVNGITFTVNDDGSVTVNGTNTSSSSAYIQLCGLVNYGNSKLIASIGQNINDVYMAIYDSNWNWIGTGSAGTISWENSSKKRLVRLAVKPGATVNNVTVYPMIRYADITDDTYEPYQPSVKEQIAYSLSVSGKSTSAAISYSGVPTLICLTPNTADSTAGGLYMINSAGAVVKLIEKTGVVVAAASSSKTFTITNNTSTVMDVCVSRCWGGK